MTLKGPKLTTRNLPAAGVRIRPNPLEFKALSDRAILPTRARNSDAGLDLYTFGEMWVEPGQSVRLHTDLAVDLPASMWGLITGRSSTVFKHGMVVLPGVVDPEYKGELLVVVHNVFEEPVQLFDGLRLAQFILMQNMNRVFEPVWGEFSEESSRGSNGFGSSGT